MGASVVAIQEDMGMSFVAGNTSEPLRQDTLGSLLKEQADKHGDKIALVSWTGASYSYKSFYQRCIHVAQALLASGVRPGDHVGIFAENCEVYVELFFATALISTVSVVLNCNYAPSELASALIAAGLCCKPRIFCRMSCLQACRDQIVNGFSHRLISGQEIFSLT